MQSRRRTGFVCLPQRHASAPRTAARRCAPERRARSPPDCPRGPAHAPRSARPWKAAARRTAARRTRAPAQGARGPRARAPRRGGRARRRRFAGATARRSACAILRSVGWLTDWRRRRVLQTHRMDDALWQRATARLSFLPRSAKLREMVLVFLAEKEFAGAHDLAVADELAGEAMPGGPVVLSWDAAAHDALMNVVIHEFAHKLDMLNGTVDGMPPLHAGMDRQAWKRAFDEAYAGFCDALERGRDTWLDPYAAEHPSEFFAVVSEAFFCEPRETQRRYPDVYDQLKLFYRQDPAARIQSEGKS